jgi:hypothetical protein
MTVGDDVFDRLASADAWVSDWPDVLERAGYRRALRLVTKRRVIVAFAAVAAVLVPLAAFAAAKRLVVPRGGRCSDADERACRRERR